MDDASGEIPKNPQVENLSKEPITLKRVITRSVNHFINTPSHKVNGKREYYHPSDAINDTLETIISEKIGLTQRQLFLLLEPTTTITPHRLTESEAFDTLLEATHTWNGVIEKLDSLPGNVAQDWYKKINNTVLAMELEKPDNFENPQVYQSFLLEKQRRSGEED